MAPAAGAISGPTFRSYRRPLVVLGIGWSVRGWGSEWCPALRAARPDVAAYGLSMAAETGEFWLPGSPDKTVRGELSIDDKGRVQVHLMGSLTSALQVVGFNPTTGATKSQPADDPPNFHIHGVLAESPRKVTLFDCWTPHRDGPFGDQVIGAGRMFRGAHLLGSEKYSAVRVRVRDIDVWASLPDPKIDRIPGVGIEVRLNFADIPPAPLREGGELGIEDVLYNGWTLHSGVRVRREVWVVARGLEGFEYREIDANFVTPIAGYLSMALGETAPLVGLQIQHGDQWIDVIHGGMKPHAGWSEKHREPLLPLWVADLNVLSSFLDVYRKVSAAVPVIRDLLSNSRGLTLDTQVLELTTLAEGVHENLFPEDERMSKADAKRVRGLVKTALEKEANPRYADIVNGTVLSYLNKPNYKSRLTRLAAEVEVAMPGVCGDRDEWVKRVDAARNNFAHRKEGFITADSIDEMLAIAQSLRWALMGNILLASKVPADVLKERLKNDSRYFYFLRTVRSAAPDIFGQQAEEEGQATDDEQQEVTPTPEH